MANNYELNRSMTNQESWDYTAFPVVVNEHGDRRVAARHDLSFNGLDIEGKPCVWTQENSVNEFHYRPGEVEVSGKSRKR